MQVKLEVRTLLCSFTYAARLLQYFIAMFAQWDRRGFIDTVLVTANFLVISILCALPGKVRPRFVGGTRCFCCGASREERPPATTTRASAYRARRHCSRPYRTRARYPIHQQLKPTLWSRSNSHLMNWILYRINPPRTHSVIVFRASGSFPVRVWRIQFCYAK